jgi:hypothetical protein
MTIAVVDFLETVQVYDYEGKLLPETLCPAQFLFEVFLKQPPVIQAGERISGGADLEFPEFAVFDKDGQMKEIHVLYHIYHCGFQRDGSARALGRLSMTLEGAVPHSCAVDVGELDVREGFEEMRQELAAHAAIK